MSLTGRLGQADDPLRRWMDSALPGLPAAARDLRKDLPAELGARTLRPAAPIPPSTVGMAIDYRLRFYLGRVVPRELRGAIGAASLMWAGRTAIDIDASDPAVWALARTFVGVIDLPGAEHHAARFFGWLGALVEVQSPAWRRLPAEEEYQLDRACVVLALYEEVYRAGMWPTSPLASLEGDADVADLLRLVPDAWVEDVAAVCGRVIDTVSFPSPRVLNPTFALSEAVGGADADLVLDRCLVDIKTTVNPRLDLQWLRQVLGYVLLDLDDRYRLDSIGLLLPRQAHLAAWPLVHLLDLAAGPGRPTLGALRADFARVVAARQPPRL